jgi:hypothetical protein
VNLYLYAAGDPVNLIDPTGHMPMDGSGAQERWSAYAAGDPEGAAPMGVAMFLASLPMLDELVGAIVMEAMMPTAVAATVGGGGGAICGGAKTVWDDIEATQPVHSGTVIPRSFELATASGNVWVHANATKHMADYATSMLGRGVSPELVNLASQIQLGSLQAAVGAGISGGVPYNQIIIVAGWELKFGYPGTADQLPALIHALLQ